MSFTKLSIDTSSYSHVSNYIKTLLITGAVRVELSLAGLHQHEVGHHVGDVTA